jgi:CubicO group peptidase (beta-lactamase class C family)
LTTHAVDDRLSVVEARVRALLEGDLHDECFGRGAQVSVATRFGRFDLAAGESRPGEPMRVDTVHNIWCGTKPLVAVAVLAALEGAGLSAETTLARIDPVLYEGIELSVGSILRHDAGLRQPDGITAQFLDLPNRRRAVFDAARQAVPEPVYSEYAGWYLLADLLARLHGSSPSAALHATFAGAVFDIAGGELAARRHGIGPYFTGVPGALVPSFHDRSGAVALGDRPALGGYVPMRTLLDFYLHVAAVLDGRSIPGFPSPAMLRRAIGDRRVTVDDPVLQRRAAFAGGFMVELVDHGYGAAAPSSAIGHSGLMGNSCGLVDPRTGVGLALFFNGFNGGPADADFLRSRYVATLFDETLCSETVR